MSTMGSRAVPRRTEWLKSNEDLTITVVASPRVVDGKVSMRNELEMVKAAVLYADSVEIVSPLIDVVLSGEELLNNKSDLSLHELIRANSLLVENLGPDSAQQEWRDFLSATILIDDEVADALERGLGKAVPMRIRDLRMELRELITAAADDGRIGSELLANMGVAELMSGISAGLVKLVPVLEASSADLLAFPNQFVEAVASLLQDAHRHVLLDDASTHLARRITGNAPVQGSTWSIGNAREALLGAGIIANLPSFSQPDLGELLDLREDLDTPLLRYRRAVAEMSRAMRTGPFDEGSVGEVEHIYRSSVAPSLLDIDEALNQHGLVRELARFAGEDVRTLLAAATASGGLVLGAAALSDMAMWLSSVVQAAPAVLPAAAVIASSVTKRADALRDVKKHDLFYLYEVNRRSRKL